MACTWVARRTTAAGICRRDVQAGSLFANPFTLKEFELSESFRRYRAYIEARMAEDTSRAAVMELLPPREQALALRDLPAGAVAFLASLQVVFVPMLSAALGEGALSARLALAACLSVSGVALLELGGLSDMGDGGAAAAAAMPLAATLLALLQPVGFGTSYLRIESLMSRFPTYGLQLSALQLISNAGISIGWLVLDALRASSADGGAGLGLGMVAAGGATTAPPTGHAAVRRTAWAGPSRCPAGLLDGLRFRSSEEQWQGGHLGRCA